ncbi:MAG: hypothetical protein NXI04_10730 [Planctomycetaceae bacterium]|nr:hypothetical protein [Planctomycetaceae bacterium]
MLANNRDPIAVRQVQWLTVAPVLHLLQALRNGFRLRVLLPCGLLILCLVLGPESSFSSLFARPDAAAVPSGAVMLAVPGRGWLPIPLAGLLSWPLRLQSPPETSVLPTVLSLLIVIGVIMIVGVAVARATSQEFCGRGRCGALASLKYSLQHILASLAATMLTFSLLLLLGLPLLFCQWLFGPDSRWLWASGITSLPLALYGIVAAFGAIVLFAGWLLSLCAIGTDGCSGADALSRGISYTLTHKLLTSVYFYVATIVSLFTKVVATFLASVAVSELPEIMRQYPPPEDARYFLTGVGLQGLRLFPLAVQLGSFLSAVCLVYLLLRERVDGIDLQEAGPPGNLAARQAPAESPEKPAPPAGLAPSGE